MVNAVDWLYTRIWCGEVLLDLAYSDIESFQRRLDLRTGILTRSFYWKPEKDIKLKVTFVRSLDRETVSLGYQQISLKVIEGSPSISILMGIDFATSHLSEGQNFWVEREKESSNRHAFLAAETRSTKQTIYAGFSLSATESLDTQLVERDKFIGRKFNVKLEEGMNFQVNRNAVNIADKTGLDLNQLKHHCLTDLEKVFPSMRWNERVAPIGKMFGLRKTSKSMVIQVINKGFATASFSYIKHTMVKILVIILVRKGSLVKHTVDMLFGIRKLPAFLLLIDKS